MLETLEYKGRLPSKDIEPYEWSNYAESHVEQQKEVIRYLEKHLVPKLPSEIMMLNVANDKEFLDIYDHPQLPYDLRGGTDIILEVQPVHVYQAIMEMIAADLYVNDKIKVFGVLTDLKDIWNIYW
ncbi:5615_t:CDS:2, partial [Paraglomus occultum]